MIRGDGHFVRIGDDFFIGETRTVHIAQDLYPTIIGDRVTVGRNAVVHACSVGSECVIGDNAVILDGSVLEDGALIEARFDGVPEIEARRRLYLCGHSGETRAGADPGGARGPRPAACGKPRPGAFPAPEGGDKSCRLRRPSSPKRRGFPARSSCKTGSSVFFGCDFDPGAFRIVIGERTNIQDNTRIRCEAAKRLSAGTRRWGTMSGWRPAGSASAR